MGKGNTMLTSIHHIIFCIATPLLSTTFGFSHGGESLAMTPNVPEFRMKQMLSDSIQLIDSFDNIGKREPNLIKK